MTYDKACKFEFKDNTLSANNAQIFTGGGVYWEKGEPTEKNITYTDNTAPSGGDKGSMAGSVRQVAPRRLQDSLTKLKSGRPGDHSF